MNIEELKMVADVINGLGDKAVLGLAAYIGAGLLATIVEVIAWLIAGWMLFIRFLPGALATIRDSAARESCAQSAMMALRDMFGAGVSGRLTDSEIRDTLKMVKEYIEKKQ